MEITRRQLLVVVACINALPIDALQNIVENFAIPVPMESPTVDDLRNVLREYVMEYAAEIKHPVATPVAPEPAVRKKRKVPLPKSPVPAVVEDARETVRIVRAHTRIVASGDVIDPEGAEPEPVAETAGPPKGRIRLIPR